jgi:hypothetical protein
MLQGTNRSDDLFLYMTRQLDAADGILPNTSYQLAFKITLASNAPSGLMGVGGSPAESVFLKAGGSSSEPQKVVDQYNYVRLNVDKGNQGQGGNAATVAGNIANGLAPGENGAPALYASIVRQVTHTANVSSDRQALAPRRNRLRLRGIYPNLSAADRSAVDQGMSPSCRSQASTIAPSHSSSSAQKGTQPLLFGTKCASEKPAGPGEGGRSCALGLKLP